MKENTYELLVLDLVTVGHQVEKTDVSFRNIYSYSNNKSHLTPFANV